MTAVDALSPQAEATIPTDLDVVLSAIGGQELTGRLIGFAHHVQVVAWAAPLLGLLLVVATLVAGGLRGRALARGLSRVLRATALVGAAILLAVAVLVATLDRGTVLGAVTVAAWRELDGAFWTSVLVLALAAGLLAVAGRPDVSLGPADLVDRARRAVLAPATPSARAVRLALLAGAGVIGVVAPGTLVDVVVRVGAVALLVVAAYETAVLVRAWFAHHRPVVGRRMAVHRPAVAAGAAALVLGTLVVVNVWPRSDQLPVAVGAGEVCNGHAELCARRFDQVTFPATHNSMSAADGPGWFLAEQPTGVMGQLRDGIRVFLVDSWPGQATARPG
ncbi:MAG: hypothetical protein EON53_14260, partial [Actinomycetales bacterium]